MSSRVRNCVIVGGGQAGAQVAIGLRQRGFEGRITLVGAESELPYARPPLSKAFLAGELSPDRLPIRPAALYEKLGIQLRLGSPVSAIDREGRRVTLACGAALPYDRLVLATGSRPRQIPVSGGHLPQVAYLRTATDAKRIRGWLAPGARIAIVGGGYIGLEVAAVAAAAGASVTVLEAGSQLLERVTGPEVARFFLDLHRSHGVRVLLGVTATAFEASQSRAVQVVSNGGERIEADSVVVGIGVVPNAELAQEAGLACADGIVVDDHGRTSDHAVLAAGDCTNHPNDRLGRRLRLESVHNAVEQAKTVAATICGASEPYAQMPWFWSDQYHHKLQSVGLVRGHERTIVRGSPERGQFAVFYLRADDVIAVDAIDMPREFAHARSVFAAESGPAPPGLEAFRLLALTRA